MNELHEQVYEALSTASCALESAARQAPTPRSRDALEEAATKARAGLHVLNEKGTVRPG